MNIFVSNAQNIEVLARFWLRLFFYWIKMLWIFRLWCYFLFFSKRPIQHLALIGESAWFQDISHLQKASREKNCASSQTFVREGGSDGAQTYLGRINFWFIGASVGDKTWNIGFGKHDSWLLSRVGHLFPAIAGVNWPKKVLVKFIVTIALRRQKDKSVNYLLYEYKLSIWNQRVL